MNADDDASTVKPRSTFRFDWLVYFAMALLWLPLGMQGKLQADGSTLTTLPLGLFHYGEAEFLSAPEAFSFEVRLGGWLRILSTIGATALLSLALRYLSHRRTEGRELPPTPPVARADRQTPSGASSLTH